MAEQDMAVNGTDLTYYEAGTGRTVVSVHGAISDARTWDDYCAAIAQSNRFVAYTQRYFGTQAWPDDGAQFTRETHIADLIAFVEGLGAGPVDLVTWSYSGEIATYAALRKPTLFRSMVHFEPAVSALLPGLSGASAARKQFIAALAPALNSLREGALEESALRFIEGVLRMAPGSAGQEAEPAPGLWRRNGRTLPLFVSMPAGDAFSCQQLSHHRIPTLLVIGEKTLLRYAIVGERLAHCSANALVSVMKDATHDGPYVHPDSFLKMITAFHALLEIDG